MEATINTNIERIGNITSSEIVALVNSKKTFDTYVYECNLERKLGRSISTETNSKPTSWGKLVEKRVFDILGMEYILSSNQTDLHPQIKYWAGSKDGIKHDEGKTVFDIKSPYTLKSFCQLADCETIEQVRNNHKDGEKYYWQLVSNACINDCQWAELIVYCPYQSELATIREMAANIDGDQNKIAWINWSTDDDLPYLIKGGYYKNLHIIRFEVPQTDKDLLTTKVLEAGKLLIDFKTKK